MADAPLHFMTISELAKLIESGEISPVEVTNAMLQRISQLDGRYKSYATLMADKALADARRAEKEIKDGRYRGPLHGVPIAVKDLCFTRGVRTMGGCKVLADHVPDFDSTVVARLEAAGAVLLGKLNLTEGAMGGYNPDFDAPKNPWNPDRWAGSSSSGSGVATAAGLCFGSLGSDTGGSIRFPSASNGIVGLKPTWGRVSRYGVLALAESLDHVGPMTRSSADAAIMLQAIAGQDADDPTTLPLPSPDMLGEINGGVRGLKIGFDDKYASDGVDAELAEAVRAGVKVLEALGAEIVEVSMPDVDSYVSAWLTLCTAEALAAHSDFYPSRRDDYGPWFRGWLDKGAEVTGADYANANNRRAECNGLIRQVFQEIDVLACPTVIGPPPVVTDEILFGPMDDLRGTSFQRYTVPYDFSGAPTLSVPCGLNGDGLPQSLQFVGKHLSEPLLCRVGHAYEQATDWHNLHPEV
ncbi:MAG: amidase [Chloroflexi bacterium]|nr:amidase [Chloroflexota bacterium]